MKKIVSKELELMMHLEAAHDLLPHTILSVQDKTEAGALLEGLHATIAAYHSYHTPREEVPTEKRICPLCKGIGLLNYYLDDAPDQVMRVACHGCNGRSLV